MKLEIRMILQTTKSSELLQLILQPKPIMEKNGVKIILIGSAKLKNIKTIFLILFVCLLLSCENKTNDSRRTLSYKLGALRGPRQHNEQSVGRTNICNFHSPR